MTLSPHDLKAGVVLDGRYELLMSVAAGGMATVWAARVRGAYGFRKRVAVKTMLPMHAGVGELERMFLDEARVAAGIHHPNVVEILDLGEHEGVLYIVMEWVEGHSVSALLKELGGEPLPLAVALSIVRATAKGLQAAHDLCDEQGQLLGLVHRDVSPQNVLVTPLGDVKVCDFGVAKATRASSEETTPGTVKGKIAYLAPEQAVGGAIDRRADVFALGILLFMTTVGVHPFKGKNDVATLTRLLCDEIPTPSQLKPGLIPAELEAVIVRAMARDPDDRYPTAEALVEAIDGLSRHGLALATAAELGAFVTRVAGKAGDQRVALLREAVREAEERSGRSARVEGPSSLRKIEQIEQIELALVSEAAEPVAKGQGQGGGEGGVAGAAAEASRSRPAIVPPQPTLPTLPPARPRPRLERDVEPTRAPPLLRLDEEPPLPSGEWLNTERRQAVTLPPSPPPPRPSLRWKVGAAVALVAAAFGSMLLQLRGVDSAAAKADVDASAPVVPREDAAAKVEASAPPQVEPAPQPQASASSAPRAPVPPSPSAKPARAPKAPAAGPRSPVRSSGL